MRRQTSGFQRIESRMLLVAFVVIPAALCGCGSDTRMTVEQLQARETELTEEHKANAGQVKSARDYTVAENTPHRIGPGDVLQVSMVGLDGPLSQFDTKVRVRSDGSIELPMIGRLDVTGNDYSAAEMRIHDAYVPEYVRALTVYLELLEQDDTTVFVTGAVQDRGPAWLPRSRRNLVYAIDAAGGFSQLTSGRVHVHRAALDEERVELYDMTNPLDVRRALAAPPLGTGDIIVADSTTDRVVYVTGLVNLPGQVEVPQFSELSTLRAIARSGGLRDFLGVREATLYRKLEDGEQVRVKLPIADMVAGEAPDIPLYAGDILDIPYTPETMLREWALNNIQIGPIGLRANYDLFTELRVERLRNDNNDDQTFADLFRAQLPNLTNAALTTP